MIIKNKTDHAIFFNGEGIVPGTNDVKKKWDEENPVIKLMVEEGQIEFVDEGSMSDDSAVSAIKEANTIEAVEAIAAKFKKKKVSEAAKKRKKELEEILASIEEAKEKAKKEKEKEEKDED